MASLLGVIFLQKTDQLSITYLKALHFYQSARFVRLNFYWWFQILKRRFLSKCRVKELSLMWYNAVKTGKYCSCRQFFRLRHKCVISQDIAVRTSDALRSVRNVRYTAAGVRERNGLLLSVGQKVLRQCGAKWVPGNPGVPRNAW